MTATFVASAWCSGFKKKSVCYGLRFGVEGRKLLSGTPSSIRIKLVDASAFDAPLTPGFWKKCPELRHALIGDWFRKQGLLLPWPGGKPHRFFVTRIGLNSFSVEMARHMP